MIGALQSVEHFTLESVNSPLPDELGALTNLASLHLECSSGVDTLPATITSLTNLTSLKLLGTGVSALPATVA